MLKTNRIMNTRVMLATSLVVNALLLGTEAYLLKRDPGDLSTSTPVIICAVHTRPDAVESPGASTASAVKLAQSFNWVRVESEDYKQYVANLRGSGCSEKTIRDTIVSDVNDLFRTRVKGQVYSSK